ncbi:MAG: GTP-binding protein [Burkholderiales bacterium]|jgi:sulfate adenylyltransferase subunit 1
MDRTGLPVRSGLLRFATAGSVDDGKSTLIGRLLYDSKSLLADHVTAIEAASRKRGLSQVDLSLLTDGLIAEREQGITIDVAYRYFATPARKFVIADSPGHAQYTRNMVTAASTADVAVLLVDAERGLQTQTRRHALLSAWVGIRRVVLAVNKMDRVGWSLERFRELEAGFASVAGGLGFDEVVAIPVSALQGDMVVERGTNLDGYTGPTLLEALETAPSRHDLQAALDGAAFRFPVQRVVRVPRGQGQPGAPAGEDFRGFQGTVSSGEVRVGDAVVVGAGTGGTGARIARIVRLDREVSVARADQAVTLVLDAEIDVSRGDVLASAGRPPSSTRTVEAELCWFDGEPQVPGLPYLLKHGTRTVRATLAAPTERVDVESLARVPADGPLAMNDIGRVRVTVQQALPFEPYVAHRVGGSFILIDELTHRTVGAGVVR